ncbi:MAG: hypothetical protein KKD39_06540 [Candidatus Altiarchaeota archaeon]|nr:hypothetical protein [Candidatus Altiarchaeota archaeon]
MAQKKVGGSQANEPRPQQLELFPDLFPASQPQPEPPKQKVEPPKWIKTGGAESGGVLARYAYGGETYVARQVSGTGILNIQLAKVDAEKETTVADGALYAVEKSEASFLGIKGREGAKCATIGFYEKTGAEGPGGNRLLNEVVGLVLENVPKGIGKVFASFARDNPYGPLDAEDSQKQGILEGSFGFGTHLSTSTHIVLSKDIKRK